MNHMRPAGGRAHLASRPVVGVVLTAVAAALLTSAGGPAGAAVAARNGAGYERAVVARINEAREARGIGPVRVAPCPDGMAEGRARQLLRTHTTPAGPARAMTEECGRPLKLDAAAITSTTPAALVKRWLRDRESRSTLLDRRVRWLGVGAVANRARRWHVSLLLVGRHAHTPQPASNEEAAPAGAADTAGEQPTELEKLQAAVFRVTNRRRVAHELAPLARSACASGFAVRHTGWMAEEGALEHAGLARLMERCSAVGAAENIASFTGVRPDARTVVRAWMRSPGHRANILDPDLTHLGVGVAFDAANRTWYATQDFLAAD